MSTEQKRGVFRPKKVYKGPVKGWGFTDFDVSGTIERFVGNFAEGAIVYWCCGEETCKKTGRKHRQGMVWFKDPMTFDMVRKGFPKGHIWKINMLRHSKRYTQKEGQWTERGELPDIMQQATAVQRMTDSIRGPARSVKDKLIDDCNEDPELRDWYLNKLKKLA